MSGPLVLGFDTSAGHCAAALVRGQDVLEATCEIMSKGQAERLMPFLQELLDRHSIAYRDLEAIGIGTGPGNFTGIRIGVSAARGLALGLGIAAYGINGFEQREGIFPQDAVVTVPAPRDMFYVRQNGEAALLPRGELGSVRTDPSPDVLAASVAKLAAIRCPAPTLAPAPYYLRAPDAAPAKDARPLILS